MFGPLEVLLGKPGTVHSPGSYLPHPGLPAEPKRMLQHKEGVGNLVRGRILAPSFHIARVSLPCYQVEGALVPTRTTAPCTLHSGTLRLYTRGPQGSVTCNISYLCSGGRGRGLAQCSHQMPLVRRRGTPPPRVVHPDRCGQRRGDHLAAVSSR